MPATIPANLLRENSIVPGRRSQLILFLLTPAEDMGKLQQLVAQLVRFENCFRPMPLRGVLSICKQYPERYAGYTPAPDMPEMHELYAIT